MAGISSIGNAIGTGIAKASASRPAEWLGKKWNKNPVDVLAYATVASIILKDGIGCAMYVTQSLNNKKIPDEKRKFVAALDLTNGVLMIAAQIAMFFAMRKYSGKIFEKMFKKSFNPAAKSDALSRIRMLEAEKGNPVPKKLKVAKDYAKVKKDALDLFKFVADIAAATIVGKRIIVPLIATPLAKKVEKKMNEGKDVKSEEPKQIVESVKTEEKPQEIEAPKLDIVSKDDNSNLLAKYKK